MSEEENKKNESNKEEKKGLAILPDIDEDKTKPHLNKSILWNRSHSFFRNQKDLDRFWTKKMEYKPGQPVPLWKNSVFVKGWIDDVEKETEKEPKKFTNEDTIKIMGDILKVSTENQQRLDYLLKHSLTKKMTIIIAISSSFITGMAVYLITTSLSITNN